MAKRDKSAEALDELARLRTEPDVELVTVQLRRHLASKTSVIVAKAATIVQQRGIDSLGPEMTLAFDRFFDASDPGCAAKRAIANACVMLGGLDADRYRRAIRHVQMEGSFGPPTDVAAPLRAAAAMGLLNVRDRDAIRWIIPLLLDGEADGRINDARRGGLRALGTVVDETSVALLRFAALRYKDDADTLGEALSALVAIDAARSFDFVADFMRSRDAAIVDTAALAIGESKQPGALALLLDGWRRRDAIDPGDARAYLTAIALTRRSEAIDALLAIVESGSSNRAVQALAALELSRGDAAVCARVCAIVDARKDRAIASAARAFVAP